MKTKLTNSDTKKALNDTEQPQFETMPDDKDQDALSLPWQAYAIVPDPNNPLSWRLPHHTKLVRRAAAGKIGFEHTVAWPQLELCVQLVSRAGADGKRVQADPEDIIRGARHLASHYIKAGKPVPDALAVLV